MGQPMNLDKKKYPALKIAKIAVEVALSGD